MCQLGVSALLLWGTFLSRAALEESGPKTSDWTQTLKTITDGIRKLNNYSKMYNFTQYNEGAFRGQEGQECVYKCPGRGEKPFPRPGYRSWPDGCRCLAFGFYFDIRMSSITSCCDKHDRCYNTCGQTKRDCDDHFQACLNTICRKLVNVADESVPVCKQAVNQLFNTIEYLSCKPYLKSQSDACECREDRTEL